MAGTTLIDKIHEFAAQAGDTDRVLAEGTTVALQVATAAKQAADANVSNISVSGHTMTVTKGTGQDATNSTITLPDNDTQYTHPAYTARTGKPTTNQAPAFGGSVTVSQITNDATGHVTGVTDRTITIPNAEATQSSSGLMSAADKTKLDLINSNGYAKGIAQNEIATADYEMTHTDFTGHSGLDFIKIAGGFKSGTSSVPDINNVGDNWLIKTYGGANNYSTFLCTSPRHNRLYKGHFWQSAWKGWEELLDNKANQIVGGEKTFINTVKMKSAQPNLHMITTDASSSTSRAPNISFYADKGAYTGDNTYNNDYQKYGAFQTNVFGSSRELSAQFWLDNNLLVTNSNDRLNGAFNLSVDKNVENFNISFAKVVSGSLVSRYYFVVDAINNNITADARLSNEISLGSATQLWKDIYAGNGTIQTSDERLKTEIEDIPESVLRAWGKVKFQQFKFKDSVTAKGSDKARIHIGAIAQRVVEAFESEGLDATRYGLLCYDEWDDIYEDVKVIDKEAVFGEVKVIDAEAMYETKTDENGNEVQVETYPEVSHMERQEIEPEQSHTEKKLVRAAGNQYSLRYEQCLCLECAYQRWLGEQREARIAALEAKVK